MATPSRVFYKMSGSGNDFVFFDCRAEPPGSLAEVSAIQAICARRTGVGADGVVFVVPDRETAFRIRYHNADGSLAELCGNATLCATNLAVTLGLAPADGFEFETDAGRVSARVRQGTPEIDLARATQVREDAAIPAEAGEEAIGYARVGVPHLVVRVGDVERVDVRTRGAFLRHHPSLADGANANFVSRRPDGRWSIRTFERGVEDETLACGTGAVATAVLLRRWSSAGDEVELRTRSGRPLVVTLPAAGSDARPSLRGEGRIVFRGELGDLDL